MSSIKFHTTAEAAAPELEIEAAAGLVGRAFAKATVTGPEDLIKPLTPACLMLIGRSLIRHGQAVFSIDVKDGAARLYPVAVWKISGSYDPSEWRYNLTLAGPSESHSIPDAPAAQVIHVMCSTDPNCPGIGFGPLQSALPKKPLDNLDTIDVLAACGLSSALFDPGSGAGASREAWREALFGVIEPLSKIVESELKEKLHPSISLSFDDLRGQINYPH